MKFNELPFHESLRKALDKIGYTELTPIQAKSIPFAMEGNDLTGLAQTGTGKTMAFLLPTLHRLLSAEEEEALPYALVLAPTRELTIQIAEEAKNSSSSQTLGWLPSLEEPITSHKNKHLETKLALSWQHLVGSLTLSKTMVSLWKTSKW